MNFKPNDQFSKPLRDTSGQWIVTQLKIKIAIIDGLKNTMSEIVKEARALETPPSTACLNMSLMMFRDEQLDNVGISIEEFTGLKQWAFDEGLTQEELDR